MQFQDMELSMKRSSILLWSLLILIAGSALWMISTGRLDSLSGSFIDGLWNSIENIVRPIFRR